MVTIELASTTEECLRNLAALQGQSVDQLASQILEDFLAMQNPTGDSSEDWARTSLALTPEVMPVETWDEEH